MIALLMALDRQPYLRIALICLAVLILALALGLQSQWVPQDWKFMWQVVTGTMLTGAISYQWFLLLSRIRGDAAALTRARYTNHRWVGSISFLLFALHAISIGHMLTNVLALLFLACAITGILNREIMRYRKEWTYRLWYSLHLAFSTLMVPLILAHIWIALAYEGI